MEIPLLLNSHSFQNCDICGNHRTLYTKENQLNPKYDGQKLIDFCFEKKSVLKENYNKNFLFDGDTIEFISLDFYNAKANDVFLELNNTKNMFVKNINTIFTENKIFNEYGNLQIIKNNYPFATHLTNINNYGMFNNGTIHINLTLPTYLNEHSEIADKKFFTMIHQKYIKYIQLLEPILIGIYGSPDIFSQVCSITDKNKFSGGSQRCSVSRYIGLGTYNADIMKSGKILTMNISDISFSKNDFWWYNKFHNESAYKKLSQIGMDINFNKHYNHGIEIRFFDHINDDQLKNVLTFLIYLGDFILDNTNKKITDSIINPGNNEVWNYFTETVIRKGIDVKINENIKKELLIFFKETGLKEFFESKIVKNLVDYCIGVEVGFDTNARKNRTGTLMENIVGKYLETFCAKNKNFSFIEHVK